MSDDDLRFGDVSDGGGAADEADGPGGAVDRIIELFASAILVVILLYVLFEVLQILWL